MSGPKPKASANKAALVASLPGASAHVISRLLFRLSLPLAVVVPVGGFAGIVWRFSHLRPSAEDIAATQAAVAKLTDEAEGRVDDALRSDTDRDIDAETRRTRRRGGPTKAQLDAIAGTLAALQNLPTPEELMRQADEARRQGRWQEAAIRYGKVALAFENSDPRAATAAQLARTQVLAEHRDEIRGAWKAYKQYRRAEWAISPARGAAADREFAKANLAEP